MGPLGTPAGACSLLNGSPPVSAAGGSIKDPPTGSASTDPWRSEVGSAGGLPPSGNITASGGAPSLLSFVPSAATTGMPVPKAKMSAVDHTTATAAVRSLRWNPLPRCPSLLSRITMNTWSPGLRVIQAEVGLGFPSRPDEQIEGRHDEQREQGGGDKAAQDDDCRRLHDLETGNLPENDNRKQRGDNRCGTRQDVGQPFPRSAEDEVKTKRDALLSLEM